MIRFLIVGLLALVACSGPGTTAPDSSSDSARPDRAQPDSVRFATYNVFLNRPAQGDLARDLATPDNPQARKVAEIIQRTAPDILVLNEFDHDPAGLGVALFKTNYLEVSQNGAAPALYPFVFIAPSNTGLASGHDLNLDGTITMEPGSRAYGGDAFGYGEFPGQYAMAVLSKYPIDMARARTFQKFLWQDMPGALLPDNPETALPADWYSADILRGFRLSSKSHWDVPIIIDGTLVHVLTSHPTPPAFDGDEDRNGKRNHDENRLWADYIAEGKGSYIYDDHGGTGGLAPGSRFVIMGDLNADPHDGGAVAGAIGQLLNSPAVRASAMPQSTGASAQALLQAGANLKHKGAPSHDTADFNDNRDTGIGNLHLDYVLYSKFGLDEIASGVFWPAPGEAYHALIGPGFPIESSDHRLVWRDLVITAK